MNLHPHPFLHIYTIKLQNRLHIPPEFLVYDIYIHFWNRPHYKNNAWWMGMRGMSECMWFKRRSRVNTNSKIWIYTKTLVLNIDCQVNYITSDNSRIPPPFHDQYQYSTDFCSNQKGTAAYAYFLILFELWIIQNSFHLTVSYTHIGY